MVVLSFQVIAIAFVINDTYNRTSKNTKAIYFQQKGQSKRANVFVIQESTAFVYSTFLT